MNPNGRDTLLVEGGHPLSGNITPQGAKNEALQVLAAVLLTEETVTLHRLPDILDVRHLIDLLRGLGVQIEDLGGGSMRFTAKDLDTSFLQGDAFRKGGSGLRGSIMLLGPLLARQGWAVSSGGFRVARNPYSLGRGIGDRHRQCDHGRLHGQGHDGGVQRGLRALYPTTMSPD